MNHPSPCPKSKVKVFVWETFPPYEPALFRRRVSKDAAGDVFGSQNKSTPDVTAPPSLAPASSTSDSTSSESSQDEPHDQRPSARTEDAHIELTSKDLKELISAVSFLNPFFPFESKDRKALRDYLWWQVVSLARRRGASVSQSEGGIENIKNEVARLLSYEQVIRNIFRTIFLSCSHRIEPRRRQHCPDYVRARRG
jgi:hypothetical protein